MWGLFSGKTPYTNIIPSTKDRQGTCNLWGQRLWDGGVYRVLPPFSNVCCQSLRATFLGGLPTNTDDGLMRCQNTCKSKEVSEINAIWPMRNFLDLDLGSNSCYTFSLLPWASLITYSICNMRVKDWIKISIVGIIFLLKVL